MNLPLPSFVDREQPITKGRCRSCGDDIYWVVTKRGRPHPLNLDGTSHFGTCPQAKGMERGMIVIIPIRPGYPVSSNHMYGRQLGVTYLNEEAEDWRNEVRVCVIGALNLYGKEVKPPCRITVDYYFPNRRRRDSHNYAKLIVDGCAMALGFDDRHITYQDGIVAVDREDPRVEIHIEEAK